MSKFVLVIAEHDQACAALAVGKRVFITPIAHTLNFPVHVQVDYISKKTLSAILKSGVVVDVTQYYVEEFV